MVIVKYRCEGSGLANIPISNIPIKEHGHTSLTNILSRKRPHNRGDKRETNPTTKKKKTHGSDETQSGSTTATSQVQVEQIATEIQSADSATSDTQQPKEPYIRTSIAAESESPNSEINVKLDAILKKLEEMKLTANKQFVAHKPGEYNEVSAVPILVQSSKLVKRISEITKLTIDVDNNMLICNACSTEASVKITLWGRTICLCMRAHCSKLMIFVCSSETYVSLL